MKFADLIELAPRAQLEFTPGEEQTLVLKNVHSTPVAWKVKTTAVEAYSVRPSHALLMPGDSARVQICLRPAVLPQDFSTHKFRVQATACKAGRTTKLEKAEWEKLKKGAIKEAGLGVIEKPAEKKGTRGKKGIAVRVKNEMNFEVEVLAELFSIAKFSIATEEEAAKRRKVLPAAGASSSSSTAVASSSSSPGTAVQTPRRKNHDNAIYSCSKAELFSLAINDGAPLFFFEAEECEAGEEDRTTRSAFENQVKIKKAASKSTSKQSNDSCSNCGSAGQEEQKSVLLRGQLYLPLDMLTCCGSAGSSATTDVFPGEQITFFEKAWEPFEDKEKFVKLFAIECARRWKDVDMREGLMGLMLDTLLSDFKSLARTFGPSRVWDLRKVTNLDWLMSDAVKQIKGAVTDWGIKESERHPDAAAQMNALIDSTFLQKLGDMDLSGWKVRGVQSMRYTFRGWRSFSGTHENAEGLDEWDVTEVCDLTGTFMQCTSFNSPLGSWQRTGKVCWGKQVTFLTAKTSAFNSSDCEDFKYSTAFSSSVLDSKSSAKASKTPDEGATDGGGPETRYGFSIGGGGPTGVGGGSGCGSSRDNSKDSASRGVDVEKDRGCGGEQHSKPMKQPGKKLAASDSHNKKQPPSKQAPSEDFESGIERQKKIAQLSALQTSKLNEEYQSGKISLDTTTEVLGKRDRMAETQLAKAKGIFEKPETLTQLLARFHKKIPANYIKADGNCLFRAFSQAVFKTQSHHAELRWIVATAMNKLEFYEGDINSAVLSDLLQEQLGHAISVEDYKTRMYDWQEGRAFWGDELCLKILVEHVPCMKEPGGR
eukprot:g17668.t1